MPKLLDKDASYTFRSYFELPYDTDEVLAEFGYSYTQKRLSLPKTDKTLSGLDQLKTQIEETLPYVQLTSEIAKREVLVAPVLTRVATLCHQVLRFEYSLKVSNWLQGNLDYLIRAQHQVIVVEAKRDDLTRGFTQLAVEMIALAMVDDAPSTIYGAVTMGNLWIFGVLDQQKKLITQDIGGYQVPDDVEDLVRVLVGILVG
ncbi:hypothetical protein D0962_11570 [Leptolyngbyaceae cyanobacterium CCMR0082]|uniref:Type I restriction enzyme R protein N-terminal domain-containing protein n=1 Tax=Adonisia turfae CCMR0082 TaxID=2304604 RepID=A0A6M0S4P2_9CYAN|nr:hypothetical protein [Adonisia turfae]NEZ63418.1 hypothetical protein [Adonisia turfae CCMR0082]